MTGRWQATLEVVSLWIVVADAFAAPLAYIGVIEAPSANVFILISAIACSLLFVSLMLRADVRRALAAHASSARSGSASAWIKMQGPLLRVFGTVLFIEMLLFTFTRGASGQVPTFMAGLGGAGGVLLSFFSAARYLLRGLEEASAERDRLHRGIDSEEAP